MRGVRKTPPPIESLTLCMFMTTTSGQWLIPICATTRLFSTSYLMQRLLVTASSMVTSLWIRPRPDSRCHRMFSPSASGRTELTWFRCSTGVSVIISSTLRAPSACGLMGLMEIAVPHFGHVRSSSGMRVPQWEQKTILGSQSHLLRCSIS
jgi:hypothetical protein